jgi:hypothetical protein
MDRTEIERALIVASLSYAAYTALWCPCKEPFLSCHKMQFYVAVGVPLAYVVYTNEVLKA